MATYISEILYSDNAAKDFIEISVPTGTDISGYTIVIYDDTGSVSSTLTIGAYSSTTAGEDVYLIDKVEPSGFIGVGSTDAVALVDDTGTVVQFISFEGSTVTAIDGPASGMTSTDIGGSLSGESLETSDDGATYFVQATPNPGTIPCYAPGTLIDTPNGPRAAETLRPGDLVITRDHGPQPIRWTRSGHQPLERAEKAARPVLISAGALGVGLPAHDLIVSPQHRIIVGGCGQIEAFFASEALAPAKSLTTLRGIRHMMGKKKITWIHFACDHHEVVVANGCWSESLLLGPIVMQGLTARQRRALARAFAPSADPDYLNGPPARPCLKVGEVRRTLAKSSDRAVAAA